MDGSRFDFLVQQLRGRGNRRSTLGFLSALGLGIGFAPSEHGAARKKRKKCKGQTKKCGKRCIPKSECCGGCGSGLTCCEGTCVDLKTSAANCGVCGNACLSRRCNGGFCECGVGTTCPTGCDCGLSIGTGVICAGALTATPCTSNDDCPTLSACRDRSQQVGGPVCAEPCLS
jgi:hypothetical protein